MDDFRTCEAEPEKLLCGPPYTLLKARESLRFRGTRNNVWWCGKGMQGPVFIHRALRRH